MAGGGNALKTAHGTTIDPRMRRDRAGSIDLVESV